MGWYGRGYLTFYDSGTGQLGESVVQALPAVDVASAFAESHLVIRASYLLIRTQLRESVEGPFEAL